MTREQVHVRTRAVTSRPARVVFSSSIADLGSASFRLKQPLTIVLEDFGDEIVASWPEVEAWGAGATDADAINDLKGKIVALHEDLRVAPDDKLGKLPLRWKRALAAAVERRG